VPGLNCYSCPGALGACPIGAMQAVIGGRQYQMSLFIAGFFMMVGALCGRFICGFFCPFGLVQELIYKIPFARKLNRFRGDRALRWLKYVILILFVILLPMLAVDAIGLASPWFCKYICPSGTLFAGIPLALANGSIRAALGNLFAWKMFVLAALVMLSVIIYRPFCKYLCPLGAVYALFNRIAFARMEVDSGACVRCEACSGICKMGCTPYINPNDTECVRCGDCVRSCPCSALSMKPYIKRGRQSAARSK
jgi:polyferredoxin